MNIFDMKFFRFLGFKKKPKAPWSKFYNKKDMDLNIPDISLYQYFYNETEKYSNLFAMDYYGRKITYKELRKKINDVASSFLSYGIRRGDVVTICMPNTPEGVISFLALNKIGAISNMIHPLSSENEIKDILISTGSVMLVTIDVSFEKIKNIVDDTLVYKVIVAKANESMPLFMNIGYQLVQGYKTRLSRSNNKYVFWKDFIDNGKKFTKSSYKYEGKKDDPAVMIHSGGTTGKSKAIVLSNANFMALVEQAKIVLDELEHGDKCLSIMPIFHGFGLGVCVFTPLCLGAECILIPQFKAQEFGNILNKHKPEFVIGVPTLFEAMLNTPKEKADKFNLNYLKYVISGGDTLKSSLENEINEFLQAHGSTTKIIQGYGMSESLAAVCLNFKSNPKPESIGVPFPGCYIGIFSPDDKEVPYGCEGEICISGPNVMLGYYNNEKETNLALHIHDDGNIWLHSGDLGIMDQDGFIKYTSRLKRLIISSGYNIYPNVVEEVLERHASVMICSVIAVPHKYKKEVPKAFIVLNKGYKESENLINELKELCSKNLPKYAIPKDFEFRKSLPKTMVGKVDFRKLQEENNKQRESEKYEKKEN